MTRSRVQVQDEEKEEEDEKMMRNAGGLSRSA